MVSDKTIHKAFIIHKTPLTKPITEIFHFHYLPKLYIGFNSIFQESLWFSISILH